MRTLNYHPAEKPGHEIVQASVGDHAKVSLRAIQLAQGDRETVIRFELTFEGVAGPRFVDILDVFPPTAELEEMIDAFETQILAYRMQAQVLHVRH